MGAVLTRNLFRFWVPGGILWIGAVLAVHHGWSGHLPPALLRFAPYGVAAAGMLLGWRFNRSKLVFALLALFTVERLLVMPFAASHRPLVVGAAGVLLPLNLAYFALMSERGFTTGRGLVRLLFLGLQPVVVAALQLWRPDVLHGWLTWSPWPLPNISSLALAEPALISFALGFLLVLLGYVRRRTAMENSFLWAGAAVFMALVTRHSATAISFYFATAGLVLIVGVIEAAHGMAFRDELTGIPGRRALEEALLKLGSCYALAMVDIDFFKKFNDTHGHEVGDQVLRMVATRLAGVGGGGKAFRYGGEEFTILFAGRSPEEAAGHLEALRETVAASGFRLRNGRRRGGGKGKGKRGKGGGAMVSVTVSIGVAGPASRQETPKQVVKAADQALYRAKKAGRNQVATR